MGNATTATERIVFTGESEVGLAVVFGETFEFASFDANSVFFDVSREQMCAFLELRWAVALSVLFANSFVEATQVKTYQRHRQ